MTHHLFLARNTSFLLFSEELLPDTRLSQQQTGGVQLHIEDWLAGVQRSSRQKKPLKTILGPLHLSRVLYKSALLCKTNPISWRPK